MQVALDVGELQAGDSGVRHLTHGMKIDSPVTCTFGQTDRRPVVQCQPGLYPTFIIIALDTEAQLGPLGELRQLSLTQALGQCRTAQDTRQKYNYPSHYYAPAICRAASTRCSGIALCFVCMQTVGIIAHRRNYRPQWTTLSRVHEFYSWPIVSQPEHLSESTIREHPATGKALCSKGFRS